jgi:tellurite resistance protein
MSTPVPPAPSGSPAGSLTFRLELLKLLLQVMWANHEADFQELKHLLALGDKWGIPDAEVKALARRVENGEPLPAPDLGLLREHRDETLRAARAVAAADGVIDLDEQILMDEIVALLG